MKIKRQEPSGWSRRKPKEMKIESIKQMKMDRDEILKERCTNNCLSPQCVFDSVNVGASFYVTIQLEFEQRNGKIGDYAHNELHFAYFIMRYLISSPIDHVRI